MILKKFKTQSQMDDMTGVFNRRGFMATVKNMLDSLQFNKKDFMVVYADVDGLKKINDTYGHDEGDIIIKGCSKVLKETFRGKDAIGRIGGDEFVIALESSHIKGLQKKLQLRFEQQEALFNKNLAGKPYKLSVSLGFAILDKSSPGSPDSIDEIMKLADDMLLKVKQQKKNEEQQ